MDVKDLDGSRVNIKDLSLEIPGKKPALDLDFTQQDWEDIRRTIERYRSLKYWDNLAEITAHLVLIDPTRSPKITPTEWEGLKQDLDRFDPPRAPKTWINFLELASNMKIIDPERFKEVPLDNDALRYCIFEVTHPSQNSIQTVREDKKYEHLMRAKILFPDKFQMPEEETWEEAKNVMASYKSLDLWGGIAIGLSATRVLWPEYPLPLELDAESWKKLAGNFETIRRGANNWDTSAERVSEHAACLQILRAQRVLVTQEKFELVMPKQANTEATSLPVGRKF